MPSQPHLRIGVKLRDVAIKLEGGFVIPVLLSESLDKAGLVAGVGRGHAVADLVPEVLATLTATAAEEEIIVHFVVGRSLGTIKHG